MNKVPKRFSPERCLPPKLITVAALACVGAISIPLTWAGEGSGNVSASAAVTKQNPALQARLASAYGKLPLSFELNAGQTDASVRFLSRGPGYSLFLTGSDAVLSLAKPGSAALRMSLAGANRYAKVTGLDELPGKSNYFIGNDPAKWRTNVPTYAKVKYENVYRGIDLVYYGNPSQLEYDFLVAPGADPKAISLNIAALAGTGRSKVQIDSGGDLLIQTGEDSVRLHKPVVYQPGEGSARHFLDGHYVLKGDSQVSFEVASYDRDKLLVIDPALVYSTYLGGSGDDFATGIAVDSSGNAYVTGSTTSTDFPTAHPLQASLGGTAGNAFVAKLNSAGSALVYSTYLGGDGYDVGYGIAVDLSGNAYVTGQTRSTNFPTAHPLQASLRSGGNAFVAKLNSAGSALVYSTYLGGSGYDNGYGIAVDSSGNTYLTGTTESTNFPTAHPLQASLRGANAFVAKLNPAGSALIYSTYLGGSNVDAGQGIAVDASGNAYVAGSTTSSDFPTANPLQASYRNSQQVFVAKLNPAGSALVYSTYLGGTGAQQGSGIAVDSAGNAYVTGATYSRDFPTANPLQVSVGGGYDAFVAKLNSAGSALVYSTYLGGTGYEYGYRIAVDSSGNAYITGFTDSIDFPTANPLQESLRGPFSAFVAKLNSAGSALVYSTYLGGSGSGQGNGIAVDASGNAYVTGFTSSTNFPTANPLQASLGGSSNAFVAKISSLSGPSCQLTNVINGPPRQLVVTMQDAASGLQSIQSTSAVNVTVNIPAFTIGATTPVIVTATKQTQSLGSEVGFLVTNRAGLSTPCDPVDFTAQIDNRMETHLFRSLSSAEHYVRILNGTPGLRSMALRVNGKLLRELRLADGETQILDIGREMHEGSNNVVLLQASGQSGASAYILIGDSSVQ